MLDEKAICASHVISVLAGKVGDCLFVGTRGERQMPVRLPGAGDYAGSKSAACQQSSGEAIGDRQMIECHLIAGAARELLSQVCENCLYRRLTVSRHHATVHDIQASQRQSIDLQVSHAMARRSLLHATYQHCLGRARVA